MHVHLCERQTPCGILYVGYRHDRLQRDAYAAGTGCAEGTYGRSARSRDAGHVPLLHPHHRIRPTLPFTPETTAYIKSQLRELLTGYGPVNTIMFDGWDAPWGRISYEDVSFPEIYAFVKSLRSTGADNSSTSER